MAKLVHLDFSRLPTEKPNPRSLAIDSLTIEETIRLMNEEDGLLSQAVRKESPGIAQAVRCIVQSFKSGGRIFFVGAGTSGRLGVLESAELPPTFGTPPALAQAIMAGGKKAVFRSQEGAEDDAEKARAEIRRKVRRGDVVVGIAASGVTPFAQSAMETAKHLGAKTIFVTCNMVNPQTKYADIMIAPHVGPEIITGSTRLKAGTATKMVLNMLTTISMVQIGKVFGNRMVDLEPRSRKLRERGIRLVQELTGLPRPKAERAFRKARGQAKTAIVMARKNLSFSEAKKWLEACQGFLRSALK